MDVFRGLTFFSVCLPVCGLGLYNSVVSMFPLVFVQAEYGQVCCHTHLLQITVSPGQREAQGGLLWTYLHQIGQLGGQKTFEFITFQRRRLVG